MHQNLRNLRTLTVVLFAAGNFGTIGGCSAAESGPPTVDMHIKGKTFVMELALTQAQQEKGLMERDDLPADHGMIFVLDKPQIISFWMHHTRFPLDIIWIAEDGTVVTIKTMQAYDENGQENSDPAKYVIELNAGKAKELGLTVGDKVEIPDKVLKTKPTGDEK